MAKRKRTKKEEPNDWDTLFADSVLEVAAGNEGAEPAVDVYESMLCVCEWVESDVKKLSAKMEADCGWGFRLRQDRIDESEARFVLLLVDLDTQAIIERLAVISVAGYVPKCVTVCRTGSSKTHTFMREEFVSELSKLLLGPESPLKDLLVWKLKKQQEGPRWSGVKPDKIKRV